MRTEESVVEYIKNLGIWNTQFVEEAELLSEVVEFLDMLPNTKVVRKEAGVKGGISDLLVCYRGKFVAIELKDNKGRPTVQQLQFIADIRKAGGAGAVCRTIQEVYNTLQE